MLPAPVIVAVPDQLPTMGYVPMGVEPWTVRVAVLLVVLMATPLTVSVTITVKAAPLSAVVISSVT